MTVGDVVGPYHVLGKLGEGGMGEVYRARDSRLKREVALKVLPADVANDRDRLARFQREAEVLASLNHPNIAHIHGLEIGRVGQVGQVGEDTLCLVMELVEGEDLAQRIARGAIPSDEALPIARQIADALEAAHEAGIVHRDLKPANVKVRADGTVKVLDFGLAKPLEPASGLARRSLGEVGSGQPASGQTLTSPAMTRLRQGYGAAGTEVGVILGTAAYMAPEQAKGRAVDKRADIWAFGCVLFEMLAGKRAFAGESVSEIIAATIKDTPSWSALPADTPSSIRRLLTRCLEKDPRDRLRDIGDARIELRADARELSDARSVDQHGRAAGDRWMVIATVGAAALAIGVGAGIFATRSRTASADTSPPLVSRFEITPPLESAVVLSGNTRDLAISRDGRRIAYVGGNGGSLFVRDLDKTEAVLLVDVGFPSQPFFSLDGKWVGFTDGANALMRVPVGGGKVEQIGRIQGPGIRATPGPDNTLVYAQVGSLWRVPIMGGEPMLVAKPDLEKKEGVFSNAEFLPTGRAILVTMGGPSASTLMGRLAVLDLATGQHKVILDDAVGALYVPSGHLVYRSGRSMRVVGFDLDKLEVVGSPVPLPEPILITAFGNYVQFDVASNGTLVYVPADAPVAARRLVWVGRDGREQPTNLPVRSYTYAAVSPDGAHAALDIRDQENDIWIWDFNRDTLRRFTFGPGFEQTPRWLSDGQHVFFNLGGSVMRQRLDGTGTPEPVYTSRLGLGAVNGVSPDGTRLVVRAGTLETNSDLMLANLSDRSSQPLLATRASELNAEISPDGRWMAYESDESGGFEIYVRPFPGVNSGRWQVSNGGGRKPLWNRNGRELFYVSEADAMMAVPIDKGASFSAGAPVQLFRGDYYFGSASSVGRTFDVTPDGQRFLMIKEDRTRPTSLSVVLNWTEELKRLAPVGERP